MQRKTHWEQVYQNKSPLEVSWYQAHPHTSLAMIEASGIGQDEAIIDVGGGASLLAGSLLAAGYQDITVLDISAAALAHAHQRLGPKGDDITWLEADITVFVPPKAYSLWHDRAVLHFLRDEADQQAYVQVLKNALRPGGHVVIATFAVGGPAKCSDLEIVQYDTAKITALLGADFELKEAREESHLTPAGKEQKFACFRLQQVG